MYPPINAMFNPDLTDEEREEEWREYFEYRAGIVNLVTMVVIPLTVICFGIMVACIVLNR